MKRVYIRDKRRLASEFQFFMQDFVDACKAFGIPTRADIFPWYKFHVRALLKHAWLLLYGCLHDSWHFHFNRKEALIVTANGVTLEDMAFPYYASFEIIPMLWDVWPSTWTCMCSSFELLDVKLVFVTSSQVAEMINQRGRQKAYWIPEGINAQLYSSGEELKERGHDVFEMGRQMKRYHDTLVNMFSDGVFKEYLTSNINDNGTLDDKHVKYSNEQLYQLMADTKVMVCFPQCDTNPSRGGHIETLTQRYWEAMLSRCLMVGRAPQELIRLIGYNPVIEVDWDNPREQLSNILDHIDNFQELVDKNFEYARRYASWDQRMVMIKKILNDNGYFFSK